MLEGLLVCFLISQDIVEKERKCEWRCQGGGTTVVYTNPQYQCPRTLYADPKDIIEKNE